MQVLTPVLCLSASIALVWGMAPAAHAWQAAPADIGPPPIPGAAQQQVVIESQDRVPASSPRKPVVEVAEPPVAAPAVTAPAPPASEPLPVELQPAPVVGEPVPPPPQTEKPPAELASEPAEPVVPAVPKPENDVPAVESEAVIFSGVQVGVSTLADVKEGWGEPESSTGDQARRVLVYKVEPFRQLEVTLEQDLVRSIVIQLAEPVTADRLAEKLKLQEFKPLEIYDASHQEQLGRAYPERGVVLTYLPGQTPPVCDHLLLEPIDPQLFVQRAAMQLHGPYTKNLADLRHALQLDPRSGEAYWRQAQILLALGRGEAALESARAALRMEPHNKQYRLTWAEGLARQGQQDKALREIERGLNDEVVTPLDRAQSLLQMAQLAATAARSDYRKASDHCLEAIKIAEPLAADPQLPVRRRAQRILVEAHLGVAHAIAWGNYKRKSEVVPKWLGQAEQLAAQMRAANLAEPDLQLQLAAGELLAHAGFQTPEYDPAPALQKAEAAIEQLSTAQPDPLWQDHLSWRWGVMFRYAMNIEHGRGQAGACLKYGEQARELMEAAAPGRATSVDAREQLGRLYFALGAVKAIHQHDHEAAIVWYDKAAALLIPLASEGTVDPTLGDLLVSMGVSYWETEMRQKAIDLTTLGTQVLEQSVEKGIVGRNVLTVPLGNLASMHRALGDKDRAADYARQAQNHTDTLKR